MKNNFDMESLSEVEYHIILVQIEIIIEIHTAIVTYSAHAWKSAVALSPSADTFLCKR